MQIRDSLFFSQLVVNFRSQSAAADLESLRAAFADPRFDQQRDILNPLGNEPVDVSATPTLELPDTVLFPDEFVQLTVSRTDPLLQLIAEAGAVVPRGDQPPTLIRKYRPAIVGQDAPPPATVVRFRPGSRRPRQDDRTPGAVCTIGTVSVAPRFDGDVGLDVMTCARVIGDQSTDDRPGRNPSYPVFGASADFPKLRANFVKLIEQSPGLDAVPGSNLLDTLEVMDRVGREYDRCREPLPHDEPEGRDDDGHEAPGRPRRFLDVAADFIAVSLIRRIPDLEVPVRLQQEWLEMLDPCARIRVLNAFVVEALDDMMTPDSIYERALRARIERYEHVLANRGSDDGNGFPRSTGNEFLQQRLEDAQAQLDDPVARLRGKLDTCGMPRAVRAQLRPELDRLSDKTDAKTMEHLRCLAELPWTGGKADTLDLERARTALDTRHFGLREAKERILEYLAVRRRKRDARGLVLCFVGPPGVGKSSLAASIAEALGRRFADMSCNVMRNASDVRGDHRTWAGAQPGRIIRQLRSVGARNPVFVLDEIDKVGEVAGEALLDAIDPTRNAAFHDLYLEVPFDLSEVFFIATANVLSRIPTALRNRLEVIEIAGYSEADKLKIAKRILVPARVRDHGLTNDLIAFDDAALKAIISDHAYEMGLRGLDRAVAALCRRAALRLETAGGRVPARRVRITEKTVRQVARRPDRPGRGPARRRAAPGGVRVRRPAAGSAADGETRARTDVGELAGRFGLQPPLHLSAVAGRAAVERARRGADRPAAHQHAARRAALWTRERQRSGFWSTWPRASSAAARRDRFSASSVRPGVGKTSLARGIADAMGRRLVAISCGGLSDETELRGHNRTWSGAQPGRIVRELVDIRVKNPVLVLDEIDKMQPTARRGGDPESALLEVLDPVQNDRFADHYVEVPFDLSEVFFVATANVRDMIPAPLQDRLEVIELPGYAEDEKFRIARVAPGRAAARRERADGRAGAFHRCGAARPDSRLHLRGGGARTRTPDRRRLPQGWPCGGRRATNRRSRSPNGRSPTCWARRGASTQCSVRPHGAPRRGAGTVVDADGWRGAVRRSASDAWRRQR